MQGNVVHQGVANDREEQNVKLPSGTYLHKTQHVSKKISYLTNLYCHSVQTFEQLLKRMKLT